MFQVVNKHYLQLFDIRNFSGCFQYWITSKHLKKNKEYLHQYKKFFKISNIIKQQQWRKRARKQYEISSGCSKRWTRIENSSNTASMWAAISKESKFNLVHSTNTTWNYWTILGLLQWLYNELNTARDLRLYVVRKQQRMTPSGHWRFFKISKFQQIVFQNIWPPEYGAPIFPNLK